MDRARAILADHRGTPLIPGCDDGYRIDLTDERSDLPRFRPPVRGAAEAASRNELDTRAELLIRALRPWRGPVPADSVGPVLHER